ncbi:inositol monophosphatase family protein [Rhodovulum adriaticum]|uniref:Histidinol phosphatase-like enzyme (Inositol monophosphatase family) n=1 Tax=Rhodovulum adriaticum TaxID=35804 RepID=A0A4R2NJD0_RHOAD|nr:inositol monophosphatase family protein [Rhodovulum adriaticum]MBK1634669.1 histidinol-phosphatase [Rhodovulum adriaticum]TCP21623.1 histidinol phosphatase-like enzyme (inositol monophosphatase family) [Rhodovulum adriaticum]
MRDHPEADSLIATAHALAEAARAATLRHFRSAALSVQDKGQGGFDPVTVADREAEAAMRAVLAERRPRDGILGEEMDDVAGETGLTWVLDPIDGTRGFMSGTPTWGVLIAVSDAQGPLYGVIDQPHIGERFEGGLGRTELTGPGGARALCTRPPRPLDRAILFSTYPEVGSPAESAAFAALSDRVQLTRYGLDCYAYALVALGQVDLVVEAGLHPYDIHAPIAVIQAAGGIVTDWRGGPAHGGGRVIAAANPEVHAAALDILSAAAG